MNEYHFTSQTQMEALFQELIEVVGTKRRNDPKFQGLEFWRSIKSVTENFDHETVVEWVPSTLTKTEQDQIMDMTEYTINGRNENKLHENNHYLIQTVRIPLTEKGNLRKVLQVGVNLGQLLGVWSEMEYLFINDRALDSLQAYLAPSEIAKLDQFLAQHPDLLTAIKSKFI